MDFTLTPEQTELRAAALTFGRSALRDDLIARDHCSKFSRELWSKCAEFGIQGLPFPVEHGGGGMDPLTAVLVMETLGLVVPVVIVLGIVGYLIDRSAARHERERSDR